jgi:steroid delta-isomerase-like uncharacterized protein
LQLVEFISCEPIIFLILKRIFLISSIFLIIIFSCDYRNNADKIEKNYQSKIDTLIEISWNKKDLSKIKNIFADDFIRIVNNVNIASNPNELEANMHVFFTGFPDLIITINDSSIKNNQVYLNWTFTGTNTGEFGEVQATGKKVKVSGFSHITFNEEGKILHEDVCYNELDFLQQLGYTLSPPIVE